MKLPAWLIGEFLGTFILVFFGCGSVAAAVLTGAQVGIFQIAIVWGIAIALAIHLTGSLSGAHLNPAVTVAMAVFGGFEKRLVPGYLAVQLLSAFTAAAVLHVIFASAFSDFETLNGITRGEPGSEASAMIYGEYFPNPGGKALDTVTKESLPMWRAFLVEAIGTALLLLAICGLTDESNRGRSPLLAAVGIGLTVTILISVIAPLTQGAFNPARDLGPRLFSSLAGWKTLPFTFNGHGWWFVYILAPFTGGLAGAALHRFILAPAYRS
ncbi:glycerol uptake facilitator protein [Haloferula helveola]|uniref:Glycerol uptake facilitator protein n=1 Tax=Haloferula helveola TaxID=490095 RepID=A0ABM7REH3_9BACT|nr:glycerol uptake facilitator protein [Haloferula helveola]